MDWSPVPESNLGGGEGEESVRRGWRGSHGTGVNRGLDGVRTPSRSGHPVFTSPTEPFQSCVGLVREYSLPVPDVRRV